MKTVTILGSCVTRESFNVEPLKNAQLELKNYLQKATCFNLFEAPLYINESMITAESNYLKRVTSYDFLKKVVTILTSEPTDFLVLDFAELRYPLLYVDGENFHTVITQSPYAKSVFLNDPGSYENYKVSFNNDIYWFPLAKIKQSMHNFAKFIKTIYDPQQIILIKGRNVFKYIGDDGIFYDYDKLDNIERENALFDTVDNLFIGEFKNEVRCINLPADVTGDPHHKLGSSPLHYEHSCYEYIAKCINMIIFNNIDQMGIDKIYEEYYDLLKIEKRKIKIRTSLVKEKKLKI